MSSANLYAAIVEKPIYPLKVKEILSDHPEYVNAVYGDNQVPLLSVALYNYSPDIVEFLLSFPGIDINKKDKLGNTPLHYAPILYIDLVEDLLEKGMKPPITVFFFIKVFDAARDSSEYPDVFYKLIQLMIADGFDVNSHTAKGQSILQYIVSMAERMYMNAQRVVLITVLDMIVQAGADLSEITSTGKTLLHLAVKSQEVTKKLLTYAGAQALMNAEDNDGYTPFMLACKSNNINIVNEFLSVPGFNPHQHTKAGNVYDMIRSPEILELLVKYSQGPAKYAVKHYSKLQTAKERAQELKYRIRELRDPIGHVLEIRNRDEMPLVFPDVDSIIIHSVGITELPPLPTALLHLNVSGNPVKLHALPTQLRCLIVANCKLEELPELPETLEYLDARDNALKDISKLPPYLYQSPIGKTNSPNNIVNSTNLLLTGNPLPIGFFNGYGSITEYSKQHIANIYEHDGESIYTMILPKGTLLFRNSSKEYNQEELSGIYNENSGHYILYPEFNVFFYPYPFVADSFMDSLYLHVFEVEQDIEVLMGVSPSLNTREDRINSKYLVSCNTVPTGIKYLKGNSYDPCFSRSFSTLHPTIPGMFVLAKQDTDRHLENDISQRFWSKYRTNFMDVRNAVGVAEIILHPNVNRFDKHSPLNYKFVGSFKHRSFNYDDAWLHVNEQLTNGTWTIDLFTKMYVNYAAASDEVKARCVPPEDPYKLHYLNTSYWKTSGGKRRKTRRVKRVRNTKGKSRRR